MPFCRVRDGYCLDYGKRLSNFCYCAMMMGRGMRLSCRPGRPKSEDVGLKMAIRFRCNKCSHTLQVPEEHAGRKAKCPNCGQVLPIPGGSKPAGKAKSAPRPQIPGGVPTGGPIPSLAGGMKKPSKGTAKRAKSASDSGKAVPSGRKPPELRSGKRPIVLAVIMVGLLVVVAVVWRKQLFGGGSKPGPSEPHTRPERRTTRGSVAEVSKLTVEEKAARTEKMEQMLAELEQLAGIKPAREEVDEALVEASKALEKFTQDLGIGSNIREGLGLVVAQNKEWLYEQVLGRARDLLGQYRFASAKKLLADCVGSESSGVPTTSSSRSTSRSRARRPSYTFTARNRCLELARSDLLRLGLEGQVCIWVREQTGEAGQEQISIRLDPPDESQYLVEHTERADSNAAGQMQGPGGIVVVPEQEKSRPRNTSRRTSRTRTPARPEWVGQWGAASEHLGYILAEKSRAEAGGEQSRAADFYALARKLEEKCTTFETAGKTDAELMERLSQRKSDRKIQQDIAGLIGQCRYTKALARAKQLLAESSENPDNSSWLIRSYLESCNAEPLGVDRSELLGQAQKAAKSSSYEVLNNILAVSLLWPDRPEGMGGARYKELAGTREIQLREVSKYGGKYTAIIDWLKAENIDIVLQDFRFSPFLSGEPVGLLDRQGVLYTVYSQEGEQDEPALTVARVPEGVNGPGMYVQMPDGWRYKIVNVFAPESAAEPNAPDGRNFAKPTVKAVVEVEQINPSSIPGHNTIPVLNRVSVLRCEPAGGGRGASGWTLLIPKTALPREQVSQESRRSTDSSRRPTAGRYGTSASNGQSRFIEINFGSARVDRRNTSRTESEVAQSLPITCLVRSERAGFSFFTDEKGQYLVGADGKRFYFDAKGLLSADDEFGVSWNIALQSRACPAELQGQIDRYYQKSISGGSAIEDRTGGRRQGQGILTAADAALWLARIARPDRSKRQGQGRPLIYRWLETEGKSIVQVEGQMLEVDQAGLDDKIFYSKQDATDLLKMAEGFYEASLQSWPTLGGQVYKTINIERLRRLIGEQGGKQKRPTQPAGMMPRTNGHRVSGRASPRTSRGQEQLSLDIYEEFQRAQASLSSGDINSALALYGDVIGASSLNLRKGISDDVVFSSVPTVKTGQVGQGEAEDGLRLFRPDVKSQALDRTTWITGRASGKSKTKRSSGLDEEGQDFQEDERFFLEADILVQACIGRAQALQKAGFAVRAREILRHTGLRIRCYLLPELNEWLGSRPGGLADVAAVIDEIKVRWQQIAEGGGDVGLQRALQAAEGQAMTVDWPKNLDSEAFLRSEGATNPGTSLTGVSSLLAGATTASEPAKAAMSLEEWLNPERAGLDELSGRALLVSSEFNWASGTVLGGDGAGEEAPIPAERAQRTIALARAYQSSGGGDLATAEALLQLGAYMAAMGFAEESAECLGQAGALYSRLAEAVVGDSEGSAGQDSEALRKYYMYRTAGLLALAEAAAMGDSAVWPDTSALLLGEIEAKISQLGRGWSKAGGDDSLAWMFTVGAETVSWVERLCFDRGYEYPRMRFWWWNYPLESEQGQAQVNGQAKVARTRGGKPAGRPRLEYIEPGANGKSGQQRKVPQMPQPAPQFLPRPAERYGI